MIDQEKAEPYLWGVVVILFLILLKRFFNGSYYAGHHHDLSDKYAVITGGNSGIGKQTALYLAKLGCNIIIGARDRLKSQQTIKQIIKVAKLNKVQFIRLDLSDKQSIENFVKSVRFQRIDYLINNAGISYIETLMRTKQGFEMQMATNHLGHFYLTYLLWPKLKKSSFFRIVNVSSLAHILRWPPKFGFPDIDFDNFDYSKEGYGPMVAYQKSKMANVMFSVSLAQRIPKDKGLAVSLHPGTVRTDLLRQVYKGYRIIIFYLIYPFYLFFTKSSWQGAQTTLHTILDEKIESGQYYDQCRKGKKNPNITKQKCQKLWQISEKCWNIEFKIDF